MQTRSIQRARWLAAWPLGLLLALALSVPQVSGAARAQAVMTIGADTDGKSSSIVLIQGKSQVIRVAAQVSRLVIGDPAVADAVLLSDSSFYLLGRQIGVTNVLVFGDDPQVPIGIIDIEVSIDIAEVARAVAAVVPGGKISVHAFNGRIRLSGEVADEHAAMRAIEVAQQFSESEVVNALRISTPKQVFLKVRIIEASRSIGKELGVSLTSDGSGSVELQTGGQGSAVPFAQIAGSVVALGSDIDLVVRSFEQRGLARNLASPTLTALSGQSASFLAGGEIPVPVSSDGGTQVEYKEFGVRLSFTPTVLESGMINLRLEPEVSQVDFANTVRDLPSFTTRRASTTVELRDGQSFVIAGLLQSSSTRRREQVPLLGDLPLIGALFRSSTLRDSETDLVIIVTPQLTSPTAANQTTATPLDNSRLASDMDFFLLGIDERPAFGAREALLGAGITGYFGHVLEAGEKGARRRD
jgi:pilus assembly protein CpaC